LAPELTVGADLQWQRDDRQNRSPDGIAITRDQFETVRELGPFLQLRARPQQRVSVTVGGRYDAVHFRADDRLLTDGDDSGERTMMALSGTVGVVVDLDVAFAPYANLGTAFETPTTTELANRPDGADGFNPELEPQRATHYEIGTRGRVASVSYSLAAYQADVRDGLIPFEIASVPGRTFFRNAGESRHRGLEAGASVTPVPGVRLSSAYSYSNLRFIDFATEDGSFDGNKMPGVPMHFFSGALAIRQGPFQADLETRATSSFYVNDANTVENDAWWVTDLRAGLTITFAGWRMSPYAGIENLFDQRYVAAVAVNAGFGRYFEPAGGRSFYVGVEAKRW
jgi:iron complex outermembrane receptor protein